MKSPVHTTNVVTVRDLELSAWLGIGRSAHVSVVACGELRRITERDGHPLAVLARL